MPARKSAPTFSEWFGTSRVVDEHGRPLVVYHGTSSAFASFKRRVGDVGIHFGTAGQANDRMDYLECKGTLKPHSGQKVIPVYLSIKNPLRMPDMGLWNADNMDYKLKELFPSDAARIRRLKSTRDIREFIQSKGYDGIVYKNTGECEGARPYQEAQDRALKALVASQRARGRPVNAFDADDCATPEYQAFHKAYKAQHRYRIDNAEDSYIVFELTQIRPALGMGDPAKLRTVNEKENSMKTIASTTLSDRLLNDIKLGIVTNAEEADLRAAELAEESGFKPGSPAMEAVTAELNKIAGDAFPGEWEDYAKNPGR